MDALAQVTRRMHAVAFATDSVSAICAARVLHSVWLALRDDDEPSLEKWEKKFALDYTRSSQDQFPASRLPPRTKGKQPVDRHVALGELREWANAALCGASGRANPQKQATLPGDDVKAQAATTAKLMIQQVAHLFPDFTFLRSRPTDVRIAEALERKWVDSSRKRSVDVLLRETLVACFIDCDDLDAKSARARANNWLKGIKM